MDASPKLLLKPALRRLLRDRDTVQLGIAPRHAVLLSGLAPPEAGLLDLLDGTRDAPAVVAAAAERGIDPERGRRLVSLLTHAGALDEPHDALSGLPPGTRARLAPDTLSLSLAHRGPGAAASAMGRRRAAAVAVRGAGRVGAAVTGLLAAAGVGRVHCLDAEPVRACDLSPAGIPSPGAPTRGAAAADVARRTTGGDATDRPPRTPPTVTVIAPSAAVAAPEVLEAARHAPHLVVSIRETTATVGPFVDPGRTACVRCVEVARGERDPAWPALTAQLVTSSRRVEPCDVALATFAASLATMHVLTWVDSGGERAPASVGGIVEFDLVDGRMRRRSLAPHPACGCLHDPTPGTMAG